MRVLNDYKCESCGKVQERYIDSTILVVSCECGKEAHKSMVIPMVALDGTNPDFPGAYNKWANVREQNLKVKRGKSYFDR